MATLAGPAERQGAHGAGANPRHPVAREGFERAADRAADAVANGGSPWWVSHARPPASGSPTPPGLPGAGAPLDGATRTAMERGFGADFSQVRIHADGAAADAARGRGALAYTTRENVVFARDRYQPRSAEGRRLLAHELTHVLQQREGAPPEQRQTGPAKPLRYDTTNVTIPPPSAPFTLADAKQLLADAIAAGKLTAGTVSGAARGSEQEAMLYYVLERMSEPDQWGSEIDLVAPIGPAPPGGGAAPVGKVTVRFNAAGKGEAILISAGAVSVPTIVTTVEDAEKQLKALYGMKGVANETATWTPEELNLVLQAFTRLPPPDKTALKGVTLIRVKDFPNPKTAGEFGSNQGVNGVTVTDEATLRLADKVFPSTPTRFLGGKDKGGKEKVAPSSYGTILHEVGHAVASKALRDARSAEFTATATSNQLVADYNAANAALGVEAGPLEALRVERNALAEAWNQANADLSAAQRSRDQAAIAAATAARDEKMKAFKAKDAEHGAALAKFGKLKADQKSKLAKSDAADVKRDALKAATTATTARPTLLARAKAAEAKSAAALSAAKAGGGKTATSQDYRAAADRAGTALADLARAVEKKPAERDAAIAAARPAAEAAVAEAKFEREALNTGDVALSVYASASAAQNAWLEALIRVIDLGGESARVQKFVDFVNDKKILPFTKYAADEWPHNPGEFFAESYTLFLNDPEYLETNAPELLTWFRKGKYR